MCNKSRDVIWMSYSTHCCQENTFEIVLDHKLLWLSISIYQHTMILTMTMIMTVTMAMHRISCTSRVLFDIWKVDRHWRISSCQFSEMVKSCGCVGIDQVHELSPDNPEECIFMLVRGFLMYHHFLRLKGFRKFADWFYGLKREAIGRMYELHERQLQLLGYEGRIAHDDVTFCITGPLCGNPPVTGGFPSKVPVMQSFGVFFLWLA